MMNSFPPPNEFEVEAEYIASLGDAMDMVKEHYEQYGFSLQEIEKLLSSTFHIGYLEGYKRSKRSQTGTLR